MMKAEDFAINRLLHIGSYPKSRRSLDFGEMSQEPTDCNFIEFSPKITCTQQFSFACDVISSPGLHTRPLSAKQIKAIDEACPEFDDFSDAGSSPNPSLSSPLSVSHIKAIEDACPEFDDFSDGGCSSLDSNSTTPLTSVQTRAGNSFGCDVISSPGQHRRLLLAEKIKAIDEACSKFDDFCEGGSSPDSSLSSPLSVSHIKAIEDACPEFDDFSDGRCSSPDSPSMTPLIYAQIGDKKDMALCQASPEFDDF
jgi:hypothetical protein